MRRPRALLADPLVRLLRSMVAVRLGLLSIANAERRAASLVR